MVQPNTDIPSFAKAIAGETTRAIQTETWRDGTTADFAVASPGKPVAISGTRTLVADGDGTLDTFTGEAKVKVPWSAARSRSSSYRSSRTAGTSSTASASPG